MMIEVHHSELSMRNTLSIQSISDNGDLSVTIGREWVYVWVYGRVEGSGYIVGSGYVVYVWLVYICVCKDDLN